MEDNEYKDIVDDIIKNYSVDLTTSDDKPVLFARLISNNNKNKRRDVLEVITELMDDNNIDITDIMDVTSYNTFDVLDNINEWALNDYCTIYHILDNDVDDNNTSGDPDRDIIQAISDYCHLKHTICDYKTVLEDIKEVFQMHGYDKKLL